MRIFFLLHDAYGTGGIVRSSFTTAGALAAAGHDVEVVSLTRRRREPFFTPPAGVQLRLLVDPDEPPTGRASWLAAFLGRRRTRLTHPGDRVMPERLSLWTDLRLVRWLRSAGPSVIVSTRPMLHLLAARWAAPEATLVVAEHMNFDTRDTRLHTALHWLAPGIDGVAVLTDRDAEDQRRLFRGTDVRVQTIPNALPWAVGDEGRPREKWVVALGRLSTQKGFDRLVQAYAPLVQSHPDWQLRIYGGGKDRDQLQRQIDQLGVGGHVQLMGRTDDAPGVLATASVLAMSSYYEGLPMVLIEALGKGLPVVAMDCPRGVRELVDDEVTGLLVPAGEVDALRKGLRRLMDDPELRARFGRAGVEEAAAYTDERVARRWEEFLTEVVARHRPVRRLRWRSRAGDRVATRAD